MREQRAEETEVAVDTPHSDTLNAGRRFRALLATFLTALLLTGGALTVSAAPAGAGTTHAVAPWGSDSNPGTGNAPWRTLSHAMGELRPGDTLVARGGTYVERIQLYPNDFTPATATAPIRVVASPGERPVIKGLLWLKGADHWTIDGIGVTWDPATGAANEHMVKFTGGRSWRLTNSEIWGAKSYAAVLVSQGAVDFRIDHNRIHDTAATNDPNQDHLIYVNNGHAGSGIIERNLLWGSPNGRGVKLGPPSLDVPGTSNITIRQNTFADNRGPSNIQISGSSNSNQIHGNILVGAAERYENITAWNLAGSDNRVYDNFGWESVAVLERDEPGLVDVGGNVHRDPVLGSDLVPLRSEALAYGHLAESTGTSSPTPSPTTEPSVDPAEALIRALHVDFLGRQPSSSEIAHHVGRLRSGTSTAQVIAGFAASDEWAGALIDGYYRSTLGRSADRSGRAYWISVMATGVSPASIAAEFYASEEYYRRAGATPETWVKDLYREILGRNADASGLRHWEQLLRSGVPRSVIAASFHGSVESRTRRVNALYRALLGRAADRSGQAYWVGVLADGQDIRLASALAASPEYARRAVARAR